MHEGMLNDHNRLFSFSTTSSCNIFKQFEHVYLYWHWAGSVIWLQPGSLITGFMVAFVNTVALYYNQVKRN